MEKRAYVVVEDLGEFEPGAECGFEVHGVFETRAEAEAAIETRPDLEGSLGVQEYVLGRSIVPEGFTVGIKHTAWFEPRARRSGYKSEPTLRHADAPDSGVEDASGVVVSVSWVGIDEAMQKLNAFLDSNGLER